MLLVVNIGNTNVACGLFEGGRLTVNRIPIGCFLSQRGIEQSLFDSLLLNNVIPEKIDGSIIASVVPKLSKGFVNALCRITGKKPLVVCAEMETGLDFSTYRAEQLGADRVAVCAAAWNQYQSPLIVIDMGTATTVNVIDQGGRFLGGAILPGFHTGLRSLSEHTAQLTETAYDPPAELIGRSTEECLLSGAYYGTAAMLDGLSDRIKEALRKEVKVVLTGGDSDRIIPFCKKPFIRNPDLLMEGLMLLYDKNAPEKPMLYR